MTVPNPPTRILIYAGVVSAFFSIRYRLDKLPRQLVSQSVARLVGCLVGRTRSSVVPPSVRRGTFHPPMRVSRSIAGIDRPCLTRSHRAACKQREKKTRGRVAFVYVRAIMVSGAGYSDMRGEISKRVKTFIRGVRKTTSLEQSVTDSISLKELSYIRILLIHKFY